MGSLKILIRGFITSLVFTVIIFISAGHLDYLQGWLFFLLNMLTTLMNYFTIYKNKELINERSSMKEGVKSWDKLLLSLSALVYLLIIIVAGLDSGRFHWTQQTFNWSTFISGAVLMIVGQIIFLTARSQNSFFSSVVRIQEERGHTVCQDGLYKIVRHPGYLGMIISLAALPLITMSEWSIIPTLAAIVLLVTRTSLEDKILRKELNGYEEYSGKTQYKLIPLVW